MKRAALLLLTLALLASSACNLVPRTGEPVSEPGRTGEAPADSGNAEISADDALDVLGKVLGGLEKLAQKAVDKGWIDTTRVQGAPSTASDPEPETEPAVPAPPPDAWHDHDFSLVVVMHKYVNVSTPFPQADETVLVTRVKDKVYIQSSVQGVLQKCTVLEPIPAGYRETIYKKGKVDWTHDSDNETLNSQVRYRLRHDYMLAQDIPAAVDLTKAQDATRCNRPAWVVEVEEDEDGAKATSTFVIDQKYRFLYSVKQVGKNKYGQDVNITLFDVTSFTDKPAAKDIPDPKAKTDPMDLYRKMVR